MGTNNHNNNSTALDLLKDNFLMQLVKQSEKYYFEDKKDSYINKVKEVAVIAIKANPNIVDAIISEFINTNLDNIK